MMMNKKPLEKLIIYLFIISNFAFNNNAQHDKKRSKHNKPKHACNDDNYFHPHVERRMFMASRVATLQNKNINTIASLRSVQQLKDKFIEKCQNENLYKEFDKEKIEFVWRYQFLESPHCIRVELDLGNLTHFKHLFNYNYYMFSYRELSKPNIHLKRQPIIDKINSLTIHKVHIRPYIVCVSFYKNDYNISSKSLTKNNATNKDEQASCSSYKKALKDDDRMHDADLCIDIDTNDHFLDLHSNHHDTTFSGELVMVIFIMCLLAVVLGVITLANYIIQKPKKRKMLLALKDYLQKKGNNNNDASNNQTNHISSIASSRNSLFKEKIANRKDSNPAIIITDFTSSNNNISYLDKINRQDNIEMKETDPLLNWNQNKFDVIPLSSNFVPITTNTIDQQGLIHKVTFNIGETIIEESPSNSELKLDENLERNDQNVENQEAVKTISHLLDDKPWLSTSPSHSALNKRSNSAINSVITNNNNNNNYAYTNANNGNSNSLTE